MRRVFLILVFSVSFLFSSIIDANKAIENKDYETALVLLKKMAYEGMIAKYKLAQMHELGKGVKKDVNKAIFIYTLSANDGYDLARNKLGNIYLEGEYVKKDLKLAKQYHALAAQQGNKSSIEILKSLENKKVNKNIAYLTIRSNVTNDRVYINNEYVGSTKLTIALEANQIYKVRVEKDGYTTYNFKDVKLKKAQKRTIMGILKRKK